MGDNGDFDTANKSSFSRTAIFESLKLIIAGGLFDGESIITP